MTNLTWEETIQLLSMHMAVRGTILSMVQKIHPLLSSFTGTKTLSLELALHLDLEETTEFTEEITAEITAIIINRYLVEEAMTSF